MKRTLFITILLLIVGVIRAHANYMDLEQCTVLNNNNPICTGEIPDVKIIEVKQPVSEESIILHFMSRFINVINKLADKDEVKITSYFEDEGSTPMSILVEDHKPEENKISCTYNRKGEKICGAGEGWEKL